MAEWEFIALTAFMMSLIALSMDMMLPALPQIGADLDVVNANDRQAVLTVFMVGLTIMQLFYSPHNVYGNSPQCLIHSDSLV